MKTLVKLLSIGFIALALAIPAFAQDKATKDEVTAKVNEAVKMAQDKGLEETLKVVGDKNGPFVWKDTYVFAIDTEKQCNVAHPVTPALVGKNLMGVKDVNGKMFFAEFINTAKEKGEGWVDYMYAKPGEKGTFPKSTFVKLVPGTTVFFAAGAY